MVSPGTLPTPPTTTSTRLFNCTEKLLPANYLSCVPSVFAFQRPSSPRSNRRKRFGPPEITEGVAAGEGVIVVEHALVETDDPAATTHRGQHRLVRADAGDVLKGSCEGGAEQAFVHEL